MAKFVFTDARFEINAVVLSDHVKQIELTVEMNEVDVTAMGNGGYSSRLAGMKRWTATATLFNDFAAANVDATIYPLMGVSTPIKIRPTTSAISATNPEFQGNAVVVSHTPISGAVGEAAMTTVKLNGVDALVRAIV